MTMNTPDTNSMAHQKYSQYALDNATPFDKLNIMHPIRNKPFIPLAIRWAYNTFHL